MIGTGDDVKMLTTHDINTPFQHTELGSEDTVLHRENNIVRIMTNILRIIFPITMQLALFP